MKVAFASNKIARLYQKGKGARRYPRQVYEAFLDAVTLMQAITNETELYAFKGLRTEKLNNHPRAAYSIRLNRQFRLIFNIERRHGNTILVIDIEDYH